MAIRGKACAYASLVLVFLLGPAFVTSALLARAFGTTLLDCRPIYGASSDEQDYWLQADGFQAVGFDIGYFVLNERPAPVGWTHFGSHGPAFPVLCGSLARVFGWGPASGPLFNVGYWAVGAAAWLCLVRPGIKQLAAAVCLSLVFWPCILYFPATMQDCLHYGLALVLAGLAHRKLNRDPRNWPCIAVTAVASLVRTTWAILLVPWALVAMRDDARWRRVAVLAAVPALFVVSRSICSPYPHSSTPEGLLSSSPDQLLAAWQQYLSNTANNVNNLLLTLVEPSPLFRSPPHQVLFGTAFGRLDVVQRYQIAALLLGGAFVAMHLRPSLRAAGPVLLAGPLLVIAVKTDTQLIVGLLLAARGCWRGRSLVIRPFLRAAACAAILALLVMLREDTVLRLLLGPVRYFGVCLILLAAILLIYRDVFGPELRRLSTAALPPAEAIRPGAFAWTNVALVCAAVVLLFQVGHGRGCRQFAPHLLLSALVLVTEVGSRAGIGLAAIGLLGLPAIGGAFVEIHAERFRNPTVIDLRPYLAYNRGRLAWDNTLLIVDERLKQWVRVPAGIGVSVVVEGEATQNHGAEAKRILAAPKSRYLFMAAKDLAKCKSGRLELLLETPFGNLYLNRGGS
jgi:hypothetical protein